MKRKIEIVRTEKGAKATVRIGHGVVATFDVEPRSRGARAELPGDARVAGESTIGELGVLLGDRRLGVAGNCEPTM